MIRIIMKPEYEKFIENQEQHFIDQIAIVLKENKGKDLLPLEKSSLDIIHAYVKQITTLHQARMIINIADEP